MLGPLLDVLLPEACPACDQPRGFEVGFCDDCALTVDAIPAIGCARCGEPGRFILNVCTRCLERPPPFDWARAAFDHGAAVARAIHRFKYEDAPELSRPLARLLVREVEVPPCDVVAPIPLHRARLVERLYDQAALLAHEVARALEHPLSMEVLTRRRPTARQVGQSEPQREQNVRGAFVASPDVRGARVLLVDDVMTTGATARAAAAACIAEGAAQVLVLTLARAVRERW